MNVLGSWKSLRNLLALILSFGCAMAHCAQAQNNVVFTPGTRVLVNPIKVYLIYWLPPGVVLDTSVSDGIGNFQTLMQQFLSDVSGSEYFNIITQYSGICPDPRPPTFSIPCVAQNFSANPVVLGGTFVDTQAYPNPGTRAGPLTDKNIQDEVTRAISQNGWAIDPNAVFFVITGVFQSNNALVEECQPNGSCTFTGAPAYCGYHDKFSSNGGTIVYSYLSDARFNITAGCFFGISTSPNGQIAADTEVALLTHELFEAITDPERNTWFDPITANEIGDNCNQQPATVVLNIFNGNTYVVQQLWDNETSSCISRSLSTGGSCSSPENAFILTDPRNNPMSVTQGGSTFAIFDMAGPWISADLGEHATGDVFFHNLPSGSAASTSPGFRFDPHCNGIMEVFVSVPLKAQIGPYFAGVKATDAVSGITARYRLPIQVKACVPDTSCPAGFGLCGPISDNCGGKVDCGGCGVSLACSNSHCCPLDSFWDIDSNQCRPNSCPPETQWCPDQGECTTLKQCNRRPPFCDGKPC